MSYTADHADALADVTADGAAVTFTRTNNATDQRAASTLAVTGFAIQVGGDPRRYEALGLVVHNAATLFFVPSTYGQVPPVGATVTWGGVTYTVRDALPVAPDGTAIASRVTVSR